MNTGYAEGGEEEVEKGGIIKSLRNHLRKILYPTNTEYKTSKRRNVNLILLR